MSDLPEGFKRCFEGFVSPRNCLRIYFDRYQDLVLFLRHYARKTVDGVVESSEQNQPDCLLAKSAVCT